MVWAPTDLVFYINDIAVGVIELKRSSVEMADGVRQLITNKEEIFNKGFFGTLQFAFAVSYSQGLRYDTTSTPEQFLVEWNDESGVNGDQLEGGMCLGCSSYMSKLFFNSRILIIGK